MVAQRAMYPREERHSEYEDIKGLSGVAVSFPPKGGETGNDQANAVAKRCRKRLETVETGGVFVMTSMWQELHGEKYWRIQTDDRAINRKLSRKVGFKRIAEGVNCPLWVYRFERASHSNAKRTFSRIAGKRPIWNKDKELYSEPQSR